MKNLFASVVPVALLVASTCLEGSGSPSVAAQTVPVRSAALYRRGHQRKRIGWLLAVLLVLGCLAYLILLVQARVLGDPLGALGRLIAPHYH